MRYKLVVQKDSDLSDLTYSMLVEDDKSGPFKIPSGEANL
jgi:hypothetical protein